MAGWGAALLAIAVVVLGSLLAAAGRDDGLSAYCLAVARNVNGATTDIHGNALVRGQHTPEELRVGKLFVASNAPTARLREAWRVEADSYVFVAPNALVRLDAFDRAELDTRKSARTDCGIARLLYEGP